MSKAKLNEYVCFIKASLASKRKLITSGIVISVGIFILNAILEMSIESTIPLVTVVMYFVVIISTFQDFNFLHRREEIAYYLGKPTTLWSLVKKNLITNLIIWVSVYGFLLLFSLIWVDYYVQIYFFDSLLSIGHFVLLYIFAVVLASVLATSLLSTLLTSIVLVGMPFILTQILSSHVNLVTQYVQGFVGLKHYFDVVEHVASRVYVISAHDFSYSFLLEQLVYLGVIFAITFISLKYSCRWRKNENESRGFVFGQVQTLLTIIVSSFFAVIISSTVAVGIGKVVSAYTVYVIIFFLVYFTATMILDLRFKITSAMVKMASVSVVTIVMFLALLNTYFVVAAHKVPNTDDVTSVTISTYNNSYGLLTSPGLVLTEKDDIEKAINLHRSVIESRYKSVNLRGAIIEFHYNVRMGLDVTRTFGGANYGSYLEEDKGIKDSFKEFREDDTINKKLAQEMLSTPKGFELDTLTINDIKNSTKYSSIDFEEFKAIMLNDLAEYIHDYAEISDISRRPDYYYYYGNKGEYSAGVTYFSEIDNQDLTPSYRVIINFESGNGSQLQKTFILMEGYFEDLIKYIEK